MKSQPCGRNRAFNIASLLRHCEHQKRYIKTTIAAAPCLFQYGQVPKTFHWMAIKALIRQRFVYVGRERHYNEFEKSKTYFKVVLMKRGWLKRIHMCINCIIVYCSIFPTDCLLGNLSLKKKIDCNVMSLFNDAWQGLQIAFDKRNPEKLVPWF